MKNVWHVGAGFDLVEGEWLEDSRAIEKAWFVEATNEYGDRYYWNGVRSEQHALNIELVAQKQIERGEFDITQGEWEKSSEVVYGSPAYQADWRAQEYMRMDDEEKYFYHRR
jgi:hypothetical protein